LVRKRPIRARTRRSQCSRSVRLDGVSSRTCNTPVSLAYERRGVSGVCHPQAWGSAAVIQVW
jgi:hypothetical protein